MKTKVITTSVLLATLGLSACTKNYTTYQVLDGRSVSDSLKANAEKRASIEAFMKLVTSDEKNIALAEILAGPVVNEDKELIRSLAQELSPEEISAILFQTQNETATLKQLFLFRGNTTLSGNDVFKQSIFNDLFETEKRKLDIEQVQLTSATFNYLKSKSMNEIFASYNHILEESSKEVAKEIITDIAEKNPTLGKKIESDAINSASLEEFLVKIRQSKELVDKIDQSFAGSDLNFKEELIAVGSGAVGILVYNEIKETKTFLALAEKCKKIKQQVEEINNHVKKIKLAVRTIKENAAKMKADQQDFTDGLSNIKNDLKSSVESAKNSYKDSDRVQGDKIVNFLYGKVLTGDSKNDSKTGETAITKLEKNLETNLNKTFKASAAMADNLSNILNLTNTISQELNIEIPKDLQKAMATATKVAAGVKLASNLVQGFMSGGVLSAVGMLNSGPGSLLGTSGSDPVVTAALGRIEGKLSQVLESQKKMLEIQVETVKMIKNLAVMIDDYHQQEMMSLASLRDFQLVNLEISKSELNSNIRQCENLINYKLKNYSSYRSSINGMTTANLDLENFYATFKTHNDLKSLIKSSGEENFTRCQSAIVDVFGAASINESKILSIFNSSEKDNLYSFQRDIYLPLNQLLHFFATDIGLNRQILHLPIKKLSDLDSKLYQLTSNFDSGSSSVNFSYNLDQLISTKTLERYLSSYLILYPLLEFDKSEWNLSIPNLVDSYYKNMLPSTGILVTDAPETISRGYFFMKNALDLVHSAIAQESLLAGEPLIPYVRAMFGKELLYNKSCKEVASALGSKFAGFDGDISTVTCSLRSNKLLMKNYLKYTVQKNIGTQFTNETYKAALNQTTDPKKLLPYLVGDISNPQINIIRVDNTWGISSDQMVIKLPSGEEVNDNTVTYSENMERLQKMQENVINALTKLSPAQYRPLKEREGLAKILLMNKL